MMGKFQVLEYSQYYMSMSGLYFRSSKPTITVFLANIYFFIFMLFFCVISSGAFVSINRSDFLLAVLASLSLIGGLQSCGCYLNIRLNVQRIKTLQNRLQEMVDQAEPSAFQIYWNTEQMCRKYTKILHRYPCMHILMFLPDLINCIRGIFSGNYDVTTWKLPFHLALPFDTIKFSGWCFEWLIQFNIGITYSVSMVTASACFVCGCLYIIGICDHIDWLINAVNDETDRFREERNLVKLRKISQNIRETLSKAVIIHAKLFDVFNLVADINSGSIFSTLPLNTVFLAICMYTVEHTNFSLFWISFFAVSTICSLLWVLIYCYFSEASTNRIASIGDTIYNSNWTDLLLNQKKFVNLIIVFSIKPVQFSGLGLIGCNIKIYGNLIKSAFSYYMIFRSFTNI